MTLLELEESKYLVDIVNENAIALTRECKGNRLDVVGEHYTAHKYLLAYYNFAKFYLMVVPLNYYSLQEYKSHYKAKLKDVEEFKDIDFTLDILKEMMLTSEEAGLMFKEYEQIFVQEEKYELLTYLKNKENEC